VTGRAAGLQNRPHQRLPGERALRVGGQRIGQDVCQFNNAGCVQTRIRPFRGVAGGIGAETRIVAAARIGDVVTAFAGAVELEAVTPDPIAVDVGFRLKSIGDCQGGQCSIRSALHRNRMAEIALDADALMLSWASFRCLPS